MGCYWWEEPIPADDVDGYAELSARLDIPVAAGENLYSLADFARFLRRGAVDIVQPDLRRAGGPTALLAIGTMAHGFRVPYASHGGGPVQLNVMACLPNALYLETGLISPALGWFWRMAARCCRRARASGGSETKCARILSQFTGSPHCCPILYGRKRGCPH